MLEKRKLWKLMRLFDKREQSKVSYWLKGELRGHHGATYQLFELMCDPEVSIEQIWASLYPKKTFPERPFYDSGFRRLEHSLSGLLETWLAIQSLRKNEEEIDLHVLRELDVRESKELFESKYKKTKRKLEAQPTRDDSYHRKMLRLKMELLGYDVRYQHNSYSTSLLGVIEQFNLASMHERFKYALFMINCLYSSNDYRNKDKIREHLNIYLNGFEKEEIDRDPILRIYSKLIELHNGEGTLNGLEDDLRSYLHLFNPVYQIDVYSTLLNYHLRSPLRGDGIKYYKRIVKIIEWGLQKNLVRQGSSMKEVAYRTLITACIYSNQVELGEHYLETLKEDIQKGLKDETYTYCKGCIRMAQGRYKEALKLLNRKFPRAAMDLRARRRVIAIRYEMGQRVELENEIRTLISCVGRIERQSSTLRNSLSSELRILGHLIKSFKRDDLHKLRQKVLETTPLFERNWLLEKIDEKLNCAHTPLLD